VGRGVGGRRAYEREPNTSLFLTCIGMAV